MVTMCVILATSSLSYAQDRKNAKETSDGCVVCLTKEEAKTVNEQTRLVEELIIRAERDRQGKEDAMARAERCEAARLEDARTAERSVAKAQAKARRRTIVWTVIGLAVGGGVGWTVHAATNN